VASGWRAEWDEEKGNRVKDGKNIRKTIRMLDRVSGG
jgi:hypothetical protein